MGVWRLALVVEFVPDIEVIREDDLATLGGMTTEAVTDPYRRTGILDHDRQVALDPQNQGVGIIIDQEDPPLASCQENHGIDRIKSRVRRRCSSRLIGSSEV